MPQLLNPTKDLQTACKPSFKTRQADVRNRWSESERQQRQLNAQALQLQLVQLMNLRVVTSK